MRRKRKTIRLLGIAALAILSLSCKKSKDESSSSEELVSSNPESQIENTSYESASISLAQDHPTYFTTNESVRLTIACGEAVQYQVTTGVGVEEVSNWQDCSDTTLDVTLNDGQNEVRIWYLFEDGFIKQVFDAATMTFFKTDVLVIKDPNPHASDDFGADITVLGNDNFIVTDGKDDTGAADAGAFYLYNGRDGSLIKAFFGDNASDGFGGDLMIKAISDNTFVACNPNDDYAGESDAGSVYYINGDTGEIISIIAGDDDDDKVGDFCKVNVLPNGNFLITVSTEDTSTLADVGAVYLVNGETGVVIAKIQGDQANDRLGAVPTTVLPNGNFLVASKTDDVGGIVDAGAVRLHNGTSGAEIAVISGDVTGDAIGPHIIDSEGNFVVYVNLDDVSGTVDKGSVTIYDSATGAQLHRVEGGGASSELGVAVTLLGNGNLAVMSPNDDTDALTNNGTVKLYDKDLTFLGEVKGDSSSDGIGSKGIVELSNGNYVINSPGDLVPGPYSNGGSMILANGSTGAEIGRTNGNGDDERLGGSSNFLELSNGNYVIGNQEGEGAFASSGEVVYISGTTGNLIARVDGDSALEAMGRNSHGLFELNNGDFIIANHSDIISGKMDVGSIIRFSGTTGLELNRITSDGEEAVDLFSEHIIKLSNGYFATSTGKDDVGPITDAGSFRLYDQNLNEVSKLEGDSASDLLGNSDLIEIPNNRLLLRSTLESYDGKTFGGTIRIIDGTTGKVLRIVSGDSDNDYIGLHGDVEENIGPQSNYVLVGSAHYNVEGVNAGAVHLIPLQ